MTFRQKPVTDNVGLSYSSSENQWFVAMNTSPPADGDAPSPAATAVAGS